MPVSSGGKLCPICDSPLQPGSKKCGFCGTDLSIFDIETEPPKKSPEPVTPAYRPSVESRVEEIFSTPVRKEPQTPKPPPGPVAEPVKEEPVPEVAKAETVAQPARESAPKEEVVKEEQAVPPSAKPPQQAVEYFECPECGASVETTASSCPKCGVMFSEEGTEMFQCPACNTLVNVDAKSCPGCGAMFVEPEAAVDDLEEVAAKEKAIPAAPQSKPELEAKPKKTKEPEPEDTSEKKGLFGGLFKRGKKEPEPELKPTEKKPAPEVIPPSKPPPSKSQSEVQVRESRPIAKEEQPSRPTPAAAPLRIAPAAAPTLAQPVSKDKGRELALMVAEMKPLLTLAHEKEIDTGESKELIDEAAMAGREKQLDRALELVEKSKNILMARIDGHLSKIITQLNEEIRVAKDLGGDVSRAQTYIQEVTRAQSSGDAEAAFVYADKVMKELQPITGRYNETKRKLALLKQYISDSEFLIVDTKEARKLITEANRAADARDFDKVDAVVRSANDSLNKSVMSRMNDELTKAKYQLTEAKAKNANITPFITILKSVTSLLKAGDYPQAVKEMHEFKDLMKRSG